MSQNSNDDEQSDTWYPPGLDPDKPTRRNLLVIGGYFTGFLAIGAYAVITDDEDEEGGDSSDGGDSTDSTENSDVENGDAAESTPTPGPPASLRVSVIDETENSPPPDRAEVWIRGHGSWFPDFRAGGDTLEEAGEFERRETHSFFVYPDGRENGVEIEVSFYLDNEYQHSPADRIDITWHDDEITVSGTPIETEYGDFSISFDR